MADGAEAELDEARLATAVAALDAAGLNLYAVFDVATLPADVRVALKRAGAPWGDFKRLVLLGHGGRQLWRSRHEFGWETGDPIDHYSRRLAERFAAHALPGTASHFLYPSAWPVPLTRLGELAGWSHPSPLGIGIHPHFGLWFAYRAAFLTTARLPLVAERPSASPCDSCLDRPCVAACPPGAVQAESPFNLTACATFRLAPSSPCRARCLARLACPIAPEHRYTAEQIRYHDGRSWQTLQAYFNPPPV